MIFWLMGAFFTIYMTERRNIYWPFEPTWEMRINTWISCLPLWPIVLLACIL